MGALLLAAAVAVSPTAVSAAAADTSARAQTEAYGSHSCGPDQKVQLSVLVNTAANVYFYRETTSGYRLDYTSIGGYSHVHKFNSRSVTWKVTSSNISTISESCAS